MVYRKLCYTDGSVKYESYKDDETALWSINMEGDHLLSASRLTEEEYNRHANDAWYAGIGVTNKHS